MMERSSKIMKTKELRKTRTKITRKSTEKKILIQLHHIANLTKAAATTIASDERNLNLSDESRALLQNDYFKVLNQNEFVAKPFVINCSNNSEVLPDDIRQKSSKNNAKPLHRKKEFKNLVSRKFKAKDRRPKNPFTVACLDINSMISIKDYKRVYYKKILENRLFINGVLVYDKLRQHYSGVNVSRNCLRKKFISKVNKATKEIPEMDGFQSTVSPENRLQEVMEFYENQENDINLFNEEREPVPEHLMEQEERPSTPVGEYFAPESFQTPPDQRLIPVNLAATSVSKYHTVFYEKDSQNGTAALFELPQSYEVTGSKINRSVFKRIDLTNDNLPCSSTSAKNHVETARLAASGNLQLQINDLQVFVGKKCPKKRLFDKYSAEDEDDFQPLGNPDDELFVRPIFSPREFKEFKKRTLKYSPGKQKFLKVDELDSFKRVSSIKTPGQHSYYPFVQFNRSK